MGETPARSGRGMGETPARSGKGKALFLVILAVVALFSCIQMHLFTLPSPEKVLHHPSLDLLELKGTVKFEVAGGGRPWRIW